MQRHMLLLMVLFVCYFMVTMNRRAFQCAIPFISGESWITKNDIGFILSAHTSGYTVSKFISGIVVDHVDSRVMMVTSLFLSSFVTQLFAFSRIVWLSCCLSFLGGCIQGMSWPAVGKILLMQMPPKSFGFGWVFISCSMNLASVVGPVVMTFISQHSHWTFSHSTIAIVSLGFSIVAFFILLSEYFAPPEPQERAESGDQQNHSITFWAIARNPVVLVLSFGYFCAALLRFTVTDWVPLYLIKERGMSEVLASSFLSTLEIGGIIGSFLAIRISDAYIAKKKHCVNPRFPCIVVLTMIACNACYLVAKHADPSNKLLLFFAAFFLGFSIYGPTSLYGVAAVECAPSHVSGSSHTIVALAANLGSVVSGYPICLLSNLVGWTVTLYLIIMILSFSGVVLVFSRNAMPPKAHVKVE